MTATLELVARAVCKEYGYTYVGPVGSGAFKETYEASESETRHAVKIYRPDVVPEPERIVREVRAMMQCNHPNIARLRRVSRLTVGETSYLYCVEEFLSGGTLSEQVTTRGLISAADAWEIGRHLISAIGHIAANGFVHRDIKPDNVMLREDGRTPVIVDFGIVRSLDQTSITVTWAQQGPGTPFFAPPEQLRNEKHLIGWRSDQFSLGVSIARVALGRHPYQVEDDEEPSVIVRRVADRQPLPPAFALRAGVIGLPVLAAMVAPWPVERLRTPDGLASAWQAQREKR